MKFLYALLMNLSKLPVIAVGLLVVPFLWRFRRRPLHKMPSYLMPWVNPEDWTEGYRKFGPFLNCVPVNVYGKVAGFWLFYKYHALRNGGDGLRNYDWHVAMIRIADLDVEILDNGYTVTQGKYGSWYREFGKVQVKFGFRMVPSDADGFNLSSFRHVYGCAPAWSFRIR